VFVVFAPCARVDDQPNRLGAILTIQGTKPKDFTVDQLCLHVLGQEIWGYLPSAIVWVVQASILPLRISPQYCDLGQSFPLGATTFCARMFFGTKINGTFGVRDVKIGGCMHPAILYVMDIQSYTLMHIFVFICAPKAAIDVYVRCINIYRPHSASNKGCILACDVRQCRSRSRNEKNTSGMFLRVKNFESLACGF
jgi:hypothetical protein